MYDINNREHYNILLIEDNPGDARLIEEMINLLRKEQYSIERASSLQEGISLIDKNNLDAILLDLSLPDSQGLETFIAIKDIVYDIPVIILTGLQDEAIALQAVELGAQDYLSKNSLDETILNRSIQYGIKRKKMEEELQLLATAMYSASNVVFITDREGVIEWVNPAFTKLTGYEAIEAIGSKPSMLKSGQQDTGFYDQTWKNILAGQVWRSEVVNRRKDGSFITVEQTITPFSGHSREITHFVAIQQDITERKRAEMAHLGHVRELEALLTITSALRKAESSSEVLTTTLDQTLMALGLTAGYVSIYEPESGCLLRAVSRGWFEQLENKPIPSTMGISGHVFSSGEIIVAAEIRENEHILPDRREQFPVGWGGVCIPIHTQNEVVGVVFISCQLPRKITSDEIKLLTSMAEMTGSTLHRLNLLEETQRNAQQLAFRVEERTTELNRAVSNLARALRVKDEFLANMSHELRTPLNAILGLSESLAEQIAGPLNEKQDRYVAAINESGHHLLALINDILDLAKVEAGQIKLDLTQTDVKAVCEASLRIIKELAQKKNMQVDFEIDPGIGQILADARRLKQMIVNLLSNAVKFTPEGGRIGLEVHVDAEDRLIELTVWDTGIGITEEDLSQLFQPFVQVNSNLNRENEGTGLGLALVSQMAGLHGGSVRVSSEPGEGSRFTIVLPWEQVPSTVANKNVKNTGRLQLKKKDAKKKPSILIMEDVQAVSMLLQDYLENEGFNIILAENGLEGVNCVKKDHPDLILMDIQMPRLNGFEATRLIRGDPASKDTPIIALTALAMPNDRQRCIEAGMNEYISKPVHLKNLLKIIQNLLAGKFEFVPVEEKAVGPAPQPIRVLIVDDEVNILNSLTRSLRDKFVVITALSGQEALDIIRKDRVAVILTDQRMPGMTGLELMQQVREISPETPGILLSGYSDSISLSATLNLENMHGHISKPWNNDELIAQLAAAAEDRAKE